MSIWNSYQKEYPLPDGFYDPMNGGTDLCPSYLKFNDRVQIWFHDPETHADAHGPDEPFKTFRVELSHCKIRECECEGRMIMDMHNYQDIALETWGQVLELIEKLPKFGAEYEGQYIQYDVFASGTNIHAIVHWEARENCFVATGIGTWRDYWDTQDISPYIRLEDAENIRVADFANITDAFTLDVWWDNTK